MIKFALLFSLLVLGLQVNQVLLVFSERTSIKLLEEFKYFKNSINISNLTKLYEDDNAQSILIIIDLSSDVLSFSILDEFCESFNIFYVTVTTENFNSYSKSRFYLKPSIKKKAESVLKLIKEFKWNSVTVASSNTLSDEYLSLSISEGAKSQLKSSFIYPDNLDFSKGFEFVLKVIKARDVKYLILIDDGESLETFLSLISFSGAAKYGFYALVVTNTVSSVGLEGCVLVSEKNSFESSSTENQIFRVVLNFLERFKSIRLSSLESACPQHECGEDFDLINIQEGFPVKVGKVGESVEITKTITFPGNNSYFSLNATSNNIQLSRFSGTSLSHMKNYFNLEEVWYRGADLAVERFNEKSKEFQIRINPLICNESTSEWLLKCLKKHQELIGIVYLSQFNILSAYESLYAFRNVSISVPQISPLAETTTVKFDPFFEFIRMSFRMREYLYNLLVLFFNFKWKDIIVFTTDDPIDQQFYLEYLKIVEAMKLSIKNPENLRIFPANYSRNDFKRFKKFFQYAKDTRCRIFHIVTLKNGDILEGLYDIGFRKGDLVVMGNWQLYYFLNENIKKKFIEKRGEIMESALLCTIPEYLGELGKDIKKELIKRYSDTRFMCLTYDLIAVIINTIEYMKILGHDYEDQILFIVNLVRRRIRGCTGDIIFAGTENYRVSSITGLSQIIYDKKLKTYLLVDVARVSSSELISIQLQRSLIWVNSEDIPKNYIDRGICGINKKQLIFLRASHLNLILMSFFTLIISIVSSFLSFRYYKRFSVIPTDEKVVGSYHDMMFLLYFPVQMFQYLCFEPKGGIFSVFFSKFQFLAGFSLIEYFELEKDLFWKIFLCLLIFSSFLTILFICCSVFYKFLDKSNTIQKKLVELSEDILPSLNNLLLIPVLSMLFEIFRCTNSTTYPLHNSFLERDCRESCYIGKHLIYSMISLGIIAVYCATTSYLRIFWELVQNSLIFCTDPEYLSSLSTFQVLLIVVHKNISIYDESLSGFAISVLLLLFALITLKVKPYNYKRITAIQVSVLLESSIIICLSSFYVRFGKNYYLYIVSLVFFLISAIICNVAIQKTPEFFLKPEADVISTLIKFQFGCCLKKK